MNIQVVKLKVENDLRGKKLKMPLSAKQKKVENDLGGEWWNYGFKVENDLARKKVENALLWKLQFRV